MHPDQNGWGGPDKTWTSGGTDVTPMKLKTVWWGTGAYDCEMSKAWKCQVSHEFDRNVLWVLNILIDCFRWRKLSPKPVPTFLFCFGLDLFFSFTPLTGITSTGKGKEFQTCKIKCILLKQGQLCWKQIIFIFYPDMVLTAKKEEDCLVHLHVSTFIY